MDLRCTLVYTPWQHRCMLHTPPHRMPVLSDLGIFRTHAHLTRLHMTGLDTPLFWALTCVLLHVSFQPSAPAGSVGWNVQFCFTSSGLYTCQAPCEPGYEPEGSIPFSVCTSPPGSSTASWSAVKGSCRKVQVSCSTTPPYSAPSEWV